MSCSILKSSFVLIALSFSIFAARPFVTDDAGTVSHNKFEIEPALSYGNNFCLAGLTVLHGISDRADFELNIGYNAVPSDERNPTIAGIMFKLGFIPNMLAATFGLTFGETIYSVNLIASKTIGRVSGDINIGYSSIADSRHTDITYGIDAVYTIARLGVGAEIFGTQEVVNWQLGLRFAITDWLTIDSGIGTTINRSPVLQATSGAWTTF